MLQEYGMQWDSASSTSIASIVTVFFIAYFIVKVFGLHYIHTFILMCKGPMPQLLSVHRPYCVYREYQMNLEGKELPKSLRVQLICEWLTMRHQAMLYPNPRTSVTSLCAETMQSGWWALSVISWWKNIIGRHAHAVNNRGCLSTVSSVKFWECRGRENVWLFFHPSLFISDWPVLCGWLSDKIFSADTGSKKSTGCAKCQLDADLSGRKKKHCVPRKNKVEKAIIYFTLLTRCGGLHYCILFWRDKGALTKQVKRHT